MNLKNKLKIFTNLKGDYKRLSQYNKGFKKQLFLIIILENIVYLSGIILAITSKNIIDSVVESNSNAFAISLSVYGSVIFSTLFIKSYLNYKRTSLNQELKNSIQSNFISNYYTKSWFDMYKYHTGDIVTRLTKDINSIVTFFTSTMPAIIALIIQMIFAFIVAISYDKTLGIFGFATLPIIAIISLVFGEKMKSQQHAINKKEGQYRSLLNEITQNVLVIKTFQNESITLKNVIAIQKEKFNLVMNKTKTTITSSLIIEIGYSLSSFIAFGWGAFRISQGIITFGTFTAIIQLISRMQAPIMGLSKMLPQYISAVSAVERCYMFNDPVIVLPSASYVDANENLGVELKSVSFKYSNDKKIIDGLSLTISPGEKVAIIGKSGIGKTTLLKVIMNLYLPDSGEIIVKKFNMSNQNSPKYYSYVPQGNTLFSGTIKSNLLIGNPNASMSDLFKALEIACALDFVKKLPQNVDTELGESGLGLSEGQLQRICIARALLRNTPILLLDEATSSLDQKTEEEVLHNIFKNYPHKTVIAITHRPSILEYVDQVIEL